MITYSHLIINAAIRRALPNLQAERTPFLLGAVIPDIPLTLLSIGTFAYNRYMVAGADMSAVMQDVFDRRYFFDPLYISAHNLWHSPTLVLIVLALTWRFHDRPGIGRWIFWLYAGISLHVLIDIATHVNDGPVLFFPFDLYTRYHSPISYWDPAHYGREFGIFEHSLDVVLLGYLFAPAIRRRLRRT